MSMANMRAMYKTTTIKARAKNRLAALFILLVNHKSKANAIPMKIAPKKARSYALIWNI